MLSKLFSSDKSQKEFWSWFVENNQQFLMGVFTESERKILYDKLDSKLNGINNKLSCLFSPLYPEGQRSMTISADGDESIFPQVEKLIEMAPQIKNWEFVAFRQPVCNEIFSIPIGIRMLSYADVYYKYAADEKVLGLQLLIKDYDQSLDLRNGVYILIDSLIGEYDTAKEINYIDWKNLEEGERADSFPLTDLPALINSRKMARNN